MNIGSRISFYRKYLSLTQADLAQGICSQGEISLIEKGLRIPSVELVTKISSRLGVSIDVFEKENFYEEQELLINTIFNKLEILVNNRNYEDMPQYLTNNILQKYCNNPLTTQRFLSYKGIYINYHEKKFKQALEIYRKALQETNITAFSTIFDFPKHKDSYSKIETLLISGAASCFYLLKQYKNAEILFKIACENVDNIKLQLSTQILGTIYYNACKNLKSLKKYSKAIETAQKGLSFESERKTIYRSAELLFELGEIYYLQKDYAKAEKYYIKSLFLSFSTNSKHFLPLLLLALRKKDKLPLLQRNIKMIDSLNSY